MNRVGVGAARVAPRSPPLPTRGLDQLHEAITIVEGGGDKRRATGDGEPRSPAHKKVRRGAADNVIDASPASSRQSLVEVYNNSLAMAKTARKRLNKGGWITDWSPHGKRAYFLYAYEIAMVGAGGALGCMCHAWGGEPIKLQMNDKVLSIKLRQMFGKRNAKKKHAHVITLARRCLIHCHAGKLAGSGKVLRSGLVQEKDAAAVVCNSVVCFGSSSRRHLEAKVCAINVHSRYDPENPRCDAAEKLYVDMWKARFGGASDSGSVDRLCIPRVIKRKDIDLVAASKCAKVVGCAYGPS